MVPSRRMKAYMIRVTMEFLICGQHRHLRHAAQLQRQETCKEKKKKTEKVSHTKPTFNYCLCRQFKETINVFWKEEHYENEFI